MTKWTDTYRYGNRLVDQMQAIDRLHRWRTAGGWMLSVIWYCGYNPQLLLTDQRSEVQKKIDRLTYLSADEIIAQIADALGIDFDTMTADYARRFHTGGVLTGRISGPSIPAIIQRNEEIVLKSVYNKHLGQPCDPKKYRKD